MNRPQKQYRVFPSIQPGTFLPGRRGLDPILDAPNLHLYASGRAALYHGALTLKEAGCATVLAPIYHCGVEIEALRRAGLQVLFYPLKDHLTADFGWIEKNAPSGKAALLLVHYYGFPQQIEAARDFCTAHELFLIEDCAHALYSSVSTGMLGTFGDLSIFSFYKTLPLPHGGGLLRNSKELPPPKKGSSGNDLILYKMVLRSLLDYLGARRGALGSISNRVIMMYTGRIAGNSSPHEKNPPVPEGPSYYDVSYYDYGKNISFLAQFLLHPQAVAEVVAKRRANYQALAGHFRGTTKFTPLFPELPDGCCPLCFPVVVKQNNNVLAKEFTLAKMDVFIFGKFAHPICSGPLLSAGQRLRDHIVCFPVHQQLGAAEISDLATRIDGLLP